MSDATTGKAKKTPPAPLPEFDEETYLRLNPDVLVAVAEGKFHSAREHYEHYGCVEGRLVVAMRDLPRDKIIITARPGSVACPHRRGGHDQALKRGRVICCRLDQ